MNRVSIATEVWKTENGSIALSDRNNMTDEYLQNILKYSERRYMHFNNMAVSVSLELERLEKESSKAYATSVKFKDLIHSIRKEADRRGITIRSLADENPDKFDILRNDFKLDQVQEQLELAFEHA